MRGSFFTLENDDRRKWRVYVVMSGIIHGWLFILAFCDKFNKCENHIRKAIDVAHNLVTFGCQVFDVVGAWVHGMDRGVRGRERESAQLRRCLARSRNKTWLS